ncbi:MAG: alpha-galactosidase [Bryobacterales bacterium]|nr:alpha-galactosidase [Bryobacterales bacterium]
MTIRISSLLLTLAVCSGPAQIREFVQAKIDGRPAVAAVRSHMLPVLKRGTVEKNRIRGRLLRIKEQEFDRGVVQPSPGEIRVVLEKPAAAFEAMVGVDSNDLGYYSNQGRGGVVASIEVGGREAFRSPLMKEGLAAAPVKVDLGGAREFSLKLAAAGEKSRYHQAEWDQADWAMARIKLVDGSEVWLADLPVGPFEGAPAATLPFSFRYDGQPAAVPENVSRSRRELDANRTEHRVEYTVAGSTLQVRLAAVEYRDFPAVEWTVYLRNTGTERTGLIEDLQAIDATFTRGAGGEFVLHHSLGSRTKPDDYMPLATALPAKKLTHLASVGGRGSDGILPYFNIESAGRGMLLAVGWPGQWAADFNRDEARGLHVRAGQELTHFRLAPNEEVRTPLIALLFYDGDWIAGQNLWRRWMVVHNLPRPGGKLHPPQVASGSGRQTVEMQEANEENQMRFLNRELDRGLPLDYWWMDAGWYPFAKGWPDVGTWEPDAARFPRGFKPISDAAHKRNVNIIVWFEPERVRPDTWLDREHPEWLLKRERSQDRLLDLGNPAAREWLTEHVSRLIREQGIDLYRQDFNFEPLRYWREKDAPDRQGIAENKHVAGYLAYWDELRRRFPHMTIDTCASGGRRNDLETLRRGVPLWRSDEAYDPISMQSISYGIALWIPYYGTGINSVEPYLFRSQMTPALALGLDPGNYTNGYERLKQRIAEWRKAARNYNGEYYPLTAYSLDLSAWIAWQFNSPESGEGMIQVFRRPESPFEEARFRLRGLDARGTYLVTDVDSAKETAVSGAVLMDEGLPVRLAKRPSAGLLMYRRR